MLDAVAGHNPMHNNSPLLGVGDTVGPSDDHQQQHAQILTNFS